MKIYVGNLNVALDEDDVRELFSPFGPIETITMAYDEMKHSRGYCFVIFRSVEDAKKAVQQLNGHEFLGMSLKVNFVTEAPKDPAPVASSSYGELDDEGVGLVKNSQMRASLINKLMRNEDKIGPAQTLLPQPPLAQALQQPPMMRMGFPAALPYPTPCILLTGMYEAGQSEDYYDDVREDVREECGNYGAVRNVYLDRSTPGGLVYIDFDNTMSSTKARDALNGRFFAGTRITAQYAMMPTGIPQ
eukprot:TRINITY_DN595_c0_g1_i15.p1 TRINITY_DN595_c0_g1~~TRINITY_DN595_c0_g1_i15.p1  ORF type:complete len:246 (-),score=65.34 TRINITY_DN595_c0_g1_i15:567-1304(-)